ncbi:putative zinc metalloprotease EGY3, chloroplastic [Panicum miliaceum]|uniref:Zinc metalloprotease EGY3, chloroplastic n=1 Tax=Panicum miliaceum TaxID=4540 RepID=A0A3L6SAU3_PANMI|nr:putative zinc metalloprotease EGY3, chloroplastic [Panicum miliaceum]
MASASLASSFLCSSSGSTSRSAAVPRVIRIPLFSKNQYRPPLRLLRSRSVVRRSLQQEQEERTDPASSVAVASGEQQEEEATTASHHVGGENGAKTSGHAGGAEGGHGEGDGEAKRSTDEQQEVDWKSDEEFKKFMGNPSIEAAIKLEKKRADRKLRELDREPDANPVAGLLRGLAKDQLAREKQRLELAEQTFKALDLNKVIIDLLMNSLCLVWNFGLPDKKEDDWCVQLKSCFGYDTFFAVDVRRFGDGGIFIGNLRRPVEEVRPKLEKKIAEAAGTEVTLWFMEEKADDVTKQVCMVQPKAEIDLQLEVTRLSTTWGYLSAVALAVTTFGTIALMSGFFLKPGATFDDYVSDVLPLFGGFLTILGVSEVATRLTAARYGVKLSPSFLVPSNWTGCLGVMNNYESLLPNKKALFDIPVARTASAYVTSIVLAVSAFIADGSFNGGENALFVRPEFFYNNPLLSFVQVVIGPYADELGNVLPNAVEGVGVPVDPLAFAGLLGIVVTSLNLLPIGRLEGGRVAQALFGRGTAALLSFGTSVLLGAGAISGSVLCLAWGLFATFVRGGEEIPAQDEITPLGNDRLAWGFVLAVACLLTLFPNGGGTYSTSFLGDPFFRGGI